MRAASINEVLKRQWLSHKHQLTAHLPSSIEAFIESVKFPASLCALDLGSMKTGIAVSIGDQLTAVPVGTFPTSSLQSELFQLKRRIRSIKGLVIGFPLALNGRIEGSAVKRTVEVIDVFKKFIDENQTPIWFHDERYTTVQSKMQLSKRSAFNRNVDDLSAMCILQEFLEIAAAHLNRGPANDYEQL